MLKQKIIDLGTSSDPPLSMNAFNFLNVGIDGAILILDFALDHTLFKIKTFDKYLLLNDGKQLLNVKPEKPFLCQIVFETLHPQAERCCYAALVRPEQ